MSQSQSSQSQSQSQGQSNGDQPLPQQSLELIGNVERRSSVGSFPFAVSTGIFTASSRSIENTSTNLQSVSTRTGAEKDEIKVSTKCRIGFDLSFSANKYFGFISQTSSSSSDAMTSVELITVATQNDGNYPLHLSLPFSLRHFLSLLLLLPRSSSSSSHDSTYSPIRLCSCSST